MSPEHAHLVLVHLPLVGLVAALVPLAWGTLRRDRTSVILGLVMATLFSLATPLVAETGDGAEHRLEHATGPGALDAEGGRWLEIHEERGESATVMLGVAVVLLAAGLVATAKKDAPAWTRGVGAGALVVCGVSVLTLAWTAEAGGKIRHPEVRDVVTSGAHHDED